MRYSVESDAKKLHRATRAAKMKLITKQGAITYSRSAHVDQNCSTIDLVFGGNTITSRNPQWKIANDMGFNSDHRLTQTEFDIEPIRVLSAPRNWNAAHKEHVFRAVKIALENLGSPALACTAEVDRYATDLINLLSAVLSKTVLRAKPRAGQRDPKQSPNEEAAFDDAQNALRMSNSERGPERGRQREDFRGHEASAEGRYWKAKRTAYRYFLAKGTRDS